MGGIYHINACFIQQLIGRCSFLAASYNTGVDLHKVTSFFVQVGLAVGDTAAERARATLTKLGLQVLN